VPKFNGAEFSGHPFLTLIQSNNETEATYLFPLLILRSHNILQVDLNLCNSKITGNEDKS